MKWNRKAAEQGHLQAQLKLAASYYHGQGVTKDAYEADKWYGKVIAQGFNPPPLLDLEITPSQSRISSETSGSSPTQDSGPRRPVPVDSLGLVELGDVLFDAGSTRNRKYGRYFAHVIGNNAYVELPSLVTARADAVSVAELLQTNYGFEVTLLLDADRARLFDELARIERQLVSSDNLLVYYAGHGYYDEDAERGYWLPVDARRSSKSSWVSNADITDSLKKMDAKHVMVVADSCYSGSLTRGLKQLRTRKQDYLDRLIAKRARVVMSSGGLEPVADAGGNGHSVFANAFLNALSENTGVIDGHGLFSLIRRPVLVNSNQSPEYGDIRLSGHDGGDFLFVRRNDH